MYQSDGLSEDQIPVSVVSLCGCENYISVLIWWIILFLSTSNKRKTWMILSWDKTFPAVVWIWITLMTVFTETWIKEKCDCSDYPECTRVHAGGSGFEFSVWVYF